MKKVPPLTFGSSHIAASSCLFILQAAAYLSGREEMESEGRVFLKQSVMQCRSLLMTVFKMTGGYWF